MDDKLISIIVPVYNTEEYLTKCVDSVLCQSYQNWELLLVDDGSTDHSLEICREYETVDTRIRVFTQSNQGQGIARNLALDHMHGDYVTFLDSDDQLQPTTLAHMLSVSREQNADLVICGYTINNGIRMVARCAYEKQTSFEGNMLLKEYLSTHNLTSTVTGKLFAADFFNEIRFPNMRMSEDAFVLPRLMGKCEKAVCIPACYYVQTIRAGSTEQSGFSPKNLTRLACEDELYLFVQAEHSEFLPLIRDRKLHNCVMLMRQIAQEHVYLTHKRIYEELVQQVDQERETLGTYTQCVEDLSNDIKLALNNKRLFLLKHAVIGVFMKAKRILKKLIVYMKSKM